MPDVTSGIYLFISTICADWPSLNGGRFQGFPVVKVVLNENTRPRVLILFYMRLVKNWLLNFTACHCVKRVTCAWGMSIFSNIYIFLLILKWGQHKQTLTFDNEWGKGTAAVLTSLTATIVLSAWPRNHVFFLYRLFFLSHSCSDQASAMHLFNC